MRHPELAAAKANRDFVYRQVCQAVDTISDIANGRPPRASDTQPGDAPGVLAAALDEFDVSAAAAVGSGLKAAGAVDSGLKPAGAVDSGLKAAAAVASRWKEREETCM